MIVKSLGNINLDEFPVVIFGSGPAGLTTALELEKKKIKCLVIEAGEEEYSQNSQQLYEGKIIGDNLSDLSSSRLRQLGGTSGHWGGQSKLMEPYDFNLWPIKAEELNIYANKACNIINIKNIFRKSSLNNYFDQIEFQYSTVRFAEKYKKHIKDSKNIYLVLNTQLSHFEGKNKLVDEAVCIFKNSTKKIKAKYFVLACGGIENSRILLWTREKSKKLVNENLPIGKYWMTHPWILGGIGAINKQKIVKKLNNEFINYEGPLHFASKKQLLDEKKILSAEIYMTAKEDEKLYKEIIKDILCVAPEYGKKISHNLFKKDLKCGNIFMSLEEPSNPNNRVALDLIEKDQFGIPKINLFYNMSKLTVNTAKIFLEEFSSLCRKDDLGRIAIKDNIYNLEGYENLGSFHHLGGTRMGINKFDSVINKDLKVHDINNLYVSGSSNFVTGGYTNPTLTIIQFAIRLAEKISERLQI